MYATFTISRQWLRDHTLILVMLQWGARRGLLLLSLMPLVIATGDVAAR